MTGLTMKFASVVVSAIVLAAASMPATAGDEAGVRIKPAQGVSLSIGSKQAVAYFLTENSGCSVSVTMIDKAADAPGANASATRVNMVVGAGTSSQIDTTDGPSLAMTCAAGASGLKLETVPRTAYAASQQVR